MSLATAAAGLALFAGTGPAAAAAKNPKPIGYSPSHDVVSVAPNAVSVTFNKPLKARGASLKVIAENGADVGRGRVSTTHHALTRHLLANAPSGQYRIEFTGVLKNGQKVHGTFRFTAARGSGTAAANGPAGQPIPTTTPSEIVATPDPTPTGEPSVTPSSSPSPEGTLTPSAAPTGPGSTLAAAAPDSSSSDQDGGVSSGFTVVPLAVGAVLVVVAGLIARFNRPRAQTR